MSVLTRPIGKKSSPAESDSVTDAPSARSASAHFTSPIAPRAHLMPPELAIRQRQRSTRRSLRLVVIMVAVVVAGGVGGSIYLAAHSESELRSAQQETAGRQAQLAKLRDIKNTETWISSAEAAQRVGGSTDIDWGSFYDDLSAHLPAGVALTNVSADSADAQIAYEQSIIPLEGERIGTVTFTATSSTLPVLPDWIAGLRGVKGFADASAQGVTADPAQGYTATVVMHINQDAYSHRFAKEDDK